MTVNTNKLKNKRNARSESIMVEARLAEECEVIDISEEISEDCRKRRSESETFPDVKIKMSRRQEIAKSKEPPLPSVQVLGVDLLYRHHTSTILFKTAPVLALLAKALPLAQQSLSSVVTRRGEQASTFISWTDLRFVLDSGLLDLAIRDLLQGGRELSLSGDLLILGGEEVGFKVRGGTVHLDVTAAFGVLGRLAEAVDRRWGEADLQLAAGGISHKTAFKKRGSVSGRSYLSLEAFRVLCQEPGLVEQAAKLAAQVDQLVEKKDALSRELKQTVDMILRTARITPQEEPQRRRSTAHGSLVLAEVSVSLERRGGRVFLEKCAAFSALGRGAVTRCSDYRKVDRILAEAASSTSPREAVDRHFLFEREDGGQGRNRRTHISVEAMSSLVNRGFAEPGRKEALEHGLAAWKTSEGEEVIDLSESDVEGERRELKQESSGSDQEEVTLSTGPKVEIIEECPPQEQEVETSSIRLEGSGRLSLPSFGGDLQYKTVDGGTYLDLASLLQLASLLSADQTYSSLLLCKALETRGVQPSACFRPCGKNKYAFLSLEAVLLLLRGQEEQDLLVREMVEALGERGIAPREDEARGIRILPEYPTVSYRVVDGCLYLHRKSCFDMIGLEAAILGSKKGYSAVTAILVLCGLEPASCHHSSRSGRYSYISCLALLRLLESREPLVVCLAAKDRFLSFLLARLQEGALACLGPCTSLQIGPQVLGARGYGGKLYLLRREVLALTSLCEASVGDEVEVLLRERGLEPAEHCLHEGSDR